MTTLTDLFKNLDSSTDTLKTDSLTIKNNTLTMENDSIQIHNIAMMRKSEFKSPITKIDYMILGILLILSFFLPYPGILFLIGYIGIIYLRYQSHLKSKYYIVFNLGSSQNYHLFFEDKNFRNKVFDVINHAFENKTKQDIKIDIKNQTFDHATIFEKGAKQTNVSGDNNTVDNHFGQNNVVSLNGDAISGTNIANHSQVEQFQGDNDFPWQEMITELQKLANNNVLNDDIKTTFKQLLTASEEKNKENFTAIVKQNDAIFNNNFVRSTLSGVLSTIIAKILL